MDLEVVGRHALLFDDDAMAAFVNSGDALVEWNSLQIDRYDVRHLLSGPLPPRRRRHPQLSSNAADSSFNSQLDQERYLDLPPPSDDPEVEEAENPGGSGGYHTAAFSYGNTNSSADQNTKEGSPECLRFLPPFSVPENLLHSLPPTEKVHQIIARTATFVSKNGGQSEIILRVKQGDNPTFGFLMPDHNLHAYFRFLVDHQEVLQSESDAKPQAGDAIADQKKMDAAGALSLLGSLYGSGEDEDSVMENPQEFEKVASGQVNSSSSIVSHVSEKTGSSKDAASKDEFVSKYPLYNKDKPSAVKKNPSIATSKVGRTSSMKKEDVSGSCSTSLENIEEPLIEPPPDLKISVDKIVDFITKNGKQFEAALREQDSKQGRFPFLVPSNQYHPYYLKVLKKVEESKLGVKNSSLENLLKLGTDKRASSYKEDDGGSSMYSDIPYESERKEKFKMIIGKSKKELQDQPLKSAQQEHGISIDAEAAAAILQAATRGLKNPYSGIISNSPLNGIQPHGRDVKQGSDFDQKSSLPDARAIAQANVSETPDQLGSDSRLTKEQKLRAERLKKAKMFVAMLKSGAGPSKGEPSRSLSAEPSEPGVSAAPAEANRETREGSISALVDGSTSEKNENGERQILREEYNERRSRRKYRSRSELNEDNDEEEMEQNNSEDSERRQDGEDKNHKHSRKEHSSKRDRDYDKDYKKERSHRHSRKRHRSHSSPHEDDDGEKHCDSNLHRHSSKKHSSHRHKHGEDKKAQDHSRKKKHRSHRSYSRKESPRKRKVHSSGDEGSQLRRYDSSSDTEPSPGGHRGRYAEGKKRRSVSERDELEEGEISPKLSDPSKGVGSHGSRETSVDIANKNGRASSQPSETTHISDDLRAKIRAMLLTTM